MSSEIENMYNSKKCGVRSKLRHLINVKTLAPNIARAKGIDDTVVDVDAMPCHLSS